MSAVLKVVWAERQSTASAFMAWLRHSMPVIALGDMILICDVIGLWHSLHQLHQQMLNSYALLCSLFILSMQINTKCSYNNQPADQLRQNDICPVNSHCLPNGHCNCDIGYVAGCTQKAHRMDSRVENNVEITNQNYTFLQVVATSQVYTLLSFNLCRLNTTEASNFYIDVWDDNGTFQQLTKDNAQFGGKIWPIMANSCLVLTTPFMFFALKQNGQTQGLILGLKRLQSGGQMVLATVWIQQIDIWSLMGKLLFIVILCLLVTVTIAIVFIIYKRRRRRLFMQSSNGQKDIKHLDIFMPKMTLKQGDNKHLSMQLCSICLIELGEQAELRRTVCSHVFHSDCIDSWCRSKLSCPVCRKSFDLGQLTDGVQSFEIDMTVISDRQRLRENIL